MNPLVTTLAYLLLLDSPPGVQVVAIVMSLVVLLRDADIWVDYLAEKGVL